MNELMKYCNLCGSLLELKIPAGDTHQRHVCSSCEYIHYLNPRIIVCALPCHEDKVLLCKRAIEPRYGYWTVPGGFMENDETSQAGACRETLEEACARVKIEGIYGLYSLPHIDQVHLFFRASLLDLEFAAGEESLEVNLFSEAEIPWQDIAFPAVTDTLRRYFKDRQQQQFPMRYADIIVTEGETGREVVITPL